MQYKVASFFSGIGGLDLGFAWAGFDIVWACDNVDSAVASYNLNFQHKSVLVDVNTLDIKDIPEADVFIGGPPCQSFSLVGLRKMDDSRGGLVLKFKDIICAKKPSAFVIENVPGMAASRINGVRLPELLRKEFEAVGYHVTLVKLDASNFLVPQKRKRLFLIGCLKTKVNEPIGRIFAKECYDVSIDSFDIGADAAIGDLGEPTGKGLLATYNNKLSDFSQLMRRHSRDYVSLHEFPKMSQKDLEMLSHIPPGGNYMDVPDIVATQRILNFKRTGGRTTTYGRLHPSFPSYTVNTYFRRPNVGSNFHYSENRLISAREAMRFQSIPDHFEVKSTSQDARNRLIGNAVPPLLAHAVANEIMKALKSEGSLNSQLNLFENCASI